MAVRGLSCSDIENCRFASSVDQGANTRANKEANFRFGSMLSKKVFLTGEPNFSAPPVHATRADVRDHLESQEGDHRASYAPDRGLQKRRQANTVFREISGAAQFSTFSTASVISGLMQCNNTAARSATGLPHDPPDHASPTRSTPLDLSFSPTNSGQQELAGHAQDICPADRKYRQRLPTMSSAQTAGHWPRHPRRTPSRRFGEPPAQAVLLRLRCSST